MHRPSGHFLMAKTLASARPLGYKGETEVNVKHLNLRPCKSQKVEANALTMLEGRYQNFGI